MCTIFGISNTSLNLAKHACPGLWLSCPVRGPPWSVFLLETDEQSQKHKPRWAQRTHGRNMCQVAWATGSGIFNSDSEGGRREIPLQWMKLELNLRSTGADWTGGQARAGWLPSRRACAKQWGSVTLVEAEEYGPCSGSAGGVFPEGRRGEHPHTGNAGHERPWAPVRSLNFILRAVEAGKGDGGDEGGHWIFGINRDGEDGNYLKRYLEAEMRGVVTLWCGCLVRTSHLSRGVEQVVDGSLASHGTTQGSHKCPYWPQEGFRKTEGNTEWGLRGQK